MSLAAVEVTRASEVTPGLAGVRMLLKLRNLGLIAAGMNGSPVGVGRSSR